MMNQTQGEMTRDVTLMPDLGRAIEDWRTAWRECQSMPTNETIGLYCTATDLLARALLGNLAGEPGPQAVFERFHAWLVRDEEQQQ